MHSFRKIVADGVKFRWLFRYDDYDYCFPSYLLFLPVGIPRAEIRVIFRGIQDKFLLNEGLAAIKDGEPLPRFSLTIFFCVSWLVYETNVSISQMILNNPEKFAMMKEPQGL